MKILKMINLGVELEFWRVALTVITDQNDFLNDSVNKQVFWQVSFQRRQEDEMQQSKAKRCFLSEFFYDVAKQEKR